jgi:hypothetical protein
MLVDGLEFCVSVEGSFFEGFWIGYAGFLVIPNGVNSTLFVFVIFHELLKVVIIHTCFSIL